MLFPGGDGSIIGLDTGGQTLKFGMMKFRSGKGSRLLFGIVNPKGIFDPRDHQDVQKWMDWQKASRLVYLDGAGSVILSRGKELIFP